MGETLPFISKRVNSHISFSIAPIPAEDRIDPRNYQHFLLWFSANLNLPTMVIGAGGPVVFNLSFRDTAINLTISDAVCFSYHALSAIFGPKLGTRAMVQARYSWGIYAVVLPSFLNVLSMVGYLILNLIIGGQMLATVSSHLTPNTGIVVIALVSLVASFFGYKSLHWFESVSWLPTLLGLTIMLAIGGHHLRAVIAPAAVAPAPTVASTLSFAAAVIASDFSWCTMTADYGVYHNAEASNALIFTYAYLGLFLSSALMHLIGALFASAATSGAVPLWWAAYDNGNNFGGLASAVLAPSGGFGKLLMALMSLAISAPTALTMYSFGISLMNVSTWFAKVPRYVFAVLATAICIPLSVAGQTRFYDVLVAIVDIIGYWSASFAGIILIEHIVFRGASFTTSSDSNSISSSSSDSGYYMYYNISAWDNPRALPTGIAALLSFLLSFGLIVPCMAQSFFLGPIAALFGGKGGDIGLLVGFFSACLFYAGLRTVERRMFPGR
ncbi:permease for cytosine/purines, uracil, thiamine, allantoin-domain-containing protein [Mycena amicta]|nr:permease for cytosine/purines, uracil, thiamine, allantoin-domain-containing protein [Mycena amicta]